ncbi:MAG: alpha-amylase [Promethearchaeota archaeon]|nr:MAG: alpha-amylase [Candidatus Lokiarchaeota archaeon]
MKWVKHPLILEINTLPWLHHLSEKYQEKVTLKTLPEEVMNEFRNYDAVWLMGVWKRSKSSQRIAQEHTELQEEYKLALPDFSEVDVMGSPYAIEEYIGDPRIGGNEGLEAFHQRINNQGKALILDFVPNHTSLDNPLVKSNPEFYIEGSFSALLQNPELFAKIEGKLFAHGKDPHYLPWTDTLQLNAFSDQYRKKALHTLLEIQKHCEGVRCDMAMLAVNSVFLKTWGQFIEERPKTEFWNDIIPPIKEVTPEFKFIAEVYWDMEWELMRQGFDYCYDKTLYDRLLYDPARSVRGYLQADWEYSTKTLRFIENHDEKRAISAFGLEESRAAAAIALCLPGARLIHYGQHLGYKTKLPIQLNRWKQTEDSNEEIKSFYDTFTEIIHNYLTKSNLWNLGRVYKDNTPGPENPMISYFWNLKGFIIYVIVNFSAQDAGCVLDLTTHRQDISYEVNSLLNRNCINKELFVNNNKIQMNFGPWGIQILKLSF